MRATTDLFTVDGLGILVPDADVTVKFQDVEGESARDRSGMLHRTVLRRVRSWEFSYARLTRQERTYLLSLLGPGVFRFTHPDGESLCVCKGSSAEYHDAPNHLWQNFRFRVEEV